jgi:hypothetical protein
MNWKKLGQVYFVNSDNPFTLTHASNPVPFHLEKDIYRVFFNARDINNKSSITFIDLDIVKQKIVQDNHQPVFTYGNQGAYYDLGISIGNIYAFKGAHYLTFMGWSKGEQGRWTGRIGQLSMKDPNTFVDESNTPFFDLDFEDPTSLSYPFVLNLNNQLHLWYGTVDKWESSNGEMISPIKYAFSEDGVNWKKKGIVLPVEMDIAQVFSKPCVLKTDSSFHMWYTFRGKPGTKYQVGYANSDDGKNWRMDNSGVVNPSSAGWDSEMVCYPFVLRHNGVLYMLYNGNSYGKNGFGMAIASED